MRLRLSILFSILSLALLATPAWAEPSPDGERVQRRVAHSEPLSIIKPLAMTGYVPGPKHQYQGLNNCGPTTTAIAISNYGIDRTQTQVVNVLKPNPKDVNVSPQEIAAYIKSQGLDAQVRVNGSIEILTWFLSNDIPVIVEQWLHDDGGMGHYRLATGFNRERKTITFDDSLTGPDQRWSMADFDARWREFSLNRIYIPVYTPEQAGLVRALLGPDADDAQMWVRAEGAMRANLEAYPNDAYVWFGLGDALLNQNRLEEALQAYEKAYAIGFPSRFYWYNFGHFETLAKLGRWQRLVQLTQPVLDRAPVHEEMFLYRGLAYQGQGQRDAARDAFKQSVDANRNYARAQAAYKAMN